MQLSSPQSKISPMETTQKLHPGQQFPPITFERLDDTPYSFGKPGAWQALFVFRGQHCPICKKYLTDLDTKLEKFNALGVSVAAVSADSEAQTRITAEAVKPGFPLLYGMDEATMRALGLYVSEPRSTQETDHNFPEPALMIVNPEGQLQIVSQSNSPGVRPELDLLINALDFTIKSNYPTRGAWK